MSKYLSGQKLWRVDKIRDEYYFTIKLGGTEVTKILINDPALIHFLEIEEVI